MEVYQALASSIPFEMGCKGNANCRNLKICRDKNCKFSSLYENTSNISLSVFSLSLIGEIIVICKPPMFSPAIYKSNSLNQEVKLPLPFRGDGREVRKCSTFVLITNPLYLPLKRGELVCPLLESPRNVLLKYCKTLSINLFHKQANCFSLFREGTEKVPIFKD